MEKYVFLVEIGTDELPSRIVRKLGELFFKNIHIALKKVNIVCGEIIWFASSRRIAVQVFDVVVDLRLNNNYNDKNLDSDVFNNIVSDISFLIGGDITLLLTSVVNYALIHLPFSKMMRWKDKHIRFIRPIRTVSMLLNNQVILTNVFGIFTNRVVKGHHFMGKRDVFIDHAKNYEKLLLNDGCVIVDYKRRKKIIYDGVEDIAKGIGGIVDYSNNILEEVSNLSEWPVVLLGSFDKDFLSIPYEILLYVLSVKKKYFPIYDIHKKLLPYFIFVIDLVTCKSQKIIGAHEKVLYSYFFDAQFFLNYDKKYRLEGYLSGLRNVLFHKKLGSLYDKTMRMKALSSWIAIKIKVNVYKVERAAILSKCDLLSKMVSEFPFSQGIIGMYYARRDGELEEVALAQKEQYYPRFFSDTLPSNLISCVISIVDKIDTISGMFIIGEYPKGSGDPIGLRRAAISILLILIEKKIDVNLCDLLEISLSLYKGFSLEGCKRKIIDFLYKRLFILYENKGYNSNIIRVTLSERLINLVSFNERIQAVTDFFMLEESQLLLFMYKRIFNMLKGVPELFECKLEDSLFIKDEEIDLVKKWRFVRKELRLMCETSRYYDGLILLLTLHHSVEVFFNNVFIMEDGKDCSLNRLVLLYKVWSLLYFIIDTPHRMFDIRCNSVRKLRKLKTGSVIS